MHLENSISGSYSVVNVHTLCSLQSYFQHNWKCIHKCTLQFVDFFVWKFNVIWKYCCETDPVDLNHLHKTIHHILCKSKSVPFCDQIHIHASVRKDQKEQILEDFHYRNAFLFVGIWGFQSWGNMESREIFLIEFEICLSFWVACVILLFIAWAFGSMIVSEQLNYTKTWWFHAIFLPVIIEFSKCVGTYSSARFELLIYNSRHTFRTAPLFSAYKLALSLWFCYICSLILLLFKIKC